MRFSLQSSLAMSTSRLIFLFFLLILPNNSSTYQRRRKPVCPKAFHLIGNCADKKQPNTIRVVQEESVITMLASSSIGSEQYRLNCSFGTPTILNLNVHISFQFCHSFGRGVSLACLENNQENSAVADWLQQHGDDNDGCHYIAEICVYCHFWGICFEKYL